MSDTSPNTGYPRSELKTKFMNREMPNEPYQKNESEIKSLDLFHEGQDATLDGDISVAIDKIKKSLDITKIDNDDEWINYLEATIAYLNGDLITLKSLIDKVGNNKKILARLVNGLEKRGSVDYKEDYIE